MRETTMLLCLVFVISLAAIAFPGAREYLPWASLFLVLFSLWHLRTVAGTLRLQTMVARYNIFLALTDRLPDGVIDTMKIHVLDHFDLQTYGRRYEGYDKRIESYVLMKRKYLYLMVAFRLEEFRLQNERISAKWIAELSDYQEFRDVHARHGVYYPDFQQFVDRIVQDRSVKGWMFEAHKVLPESSLEQSLPELNDCQDQPGVRAPWWVTLSAILRRFSRELSNRR